MAGERQALDNALAQVGSDATIRRTVGQGNNTQNVDCDFKAMFQPMTPEKLLDGVSMSDLLVIMSPTRLQERQWPGGASDKSTNPGAPWLPKVNDQVLRKATGRWHNVKVPPQTFMVANEIVRIELTVAG